MSAMNFPTEQDFMGAVLDKITQLESSFNKIEKDVNNQCELFFKKINDRMSLIEKRVIALETKNIIVG